MRRNPQKGNPPYRRPCRYVRRLRSMVASKFNASLRRLQLFYSFFKSLVGKEVIVELKNDLRLGCVSVTSLCGPPKYVLLPFHLQHTRDAALRGPGEHWVRPRCTSPSAQWRGVAVVFVVCISPGLVRHCLLPCSTSTSSSRTSASLTQTSIHTWCVHTLSAAGSTLCTTI